MSLAGPICWGASVLVIRSLVRTYLTHATGGSDGLLPAGVLVASFWFVNQKQVVMMQRMDVIRWYLTWLCVIMLDDIDVRVSVFLVMFW